MKHYRTLGEQQSSDTDVSPLSQIPLYDLPPNIQQQEYEREQLIAPMVKRSIRELPVYTGATSTTPIHMEQQHTPQPPQFAQHPHAFLPPQPQHQPQPQLQPQPQPQHQPQPQLQQHYPYPPYQPYYPQQPIGYYPMYPYPPQQVPPQPRPKAVSYSDALIEQSEAQRRLFEHMPPYTETPLHVSDQNICEAFAKHCTECDICKRKYMSKSYNVNYIIIIGIILVIVYLFMKK